jgi:hypothetical protein
MANQQLHTNENSSHKKPPEKCPQFKIAMAGCYSSYDTWSYVYGNGKITLSYTLTTLGGKYCTTFS